MKITAPDLKELDIIDHVIKEVRGGAHRDVEQQAAYIDEALKSELKSLLKLDKNELIQQRYNKYKSIGKISTENQFVGIK